VRKDLLFYIFEKLFKESNKYKKNGKKVAHLENAQYQQPVAEWIDIVLKNHNIQVKKSKEYCSKIYQYALRMKAEDLIGFSLYYLGEADYIENNVDGLFLNITKALHFLDKTKQWELMARGYNLLGISSLSRGNAPFAMDYYLDALHYCNAYGLDHVGIIANMNIGTLYNVLGEYAIAQKYFDIGVQYLYKSKDLPNYYSYLLNYYSSSGNAYISRELFDEAKQCQKKAKEECLEKVGILEKICYNIFASRLANEIGELENRDVMIRQLGEIITKEIELLSIFDDLFLLCEMLLKIQEYKEFWKIINILQKLAEESNIINMHLQALDLKIRFFKVMDNQVEFLRIAGEYYELSQKMQTENQFMVKRMIHVRNYLEESKKQKEEMEKKNKILQERSETDPLTGLYNRFRLNTFAEELFMKANNEKKSLTVEILDIDYFKEYNDHYGHPAGDTCIIKIAEEIKKMAAKENIFCARYGGDEFILIFDNFTKEQVVEFTKKLRNSTMKLNIEHKFAKNIPIVTISQGVCQDIPKKKNKVWDFLSTADNMLYQVKQFGRNNIAFGTLGTSVGEICIEG